jgi:SAM-dependent methyltransferase
LILDDVPHTHWSATRAINIAHGVEAPEKEPEEGYDVHPFVRKAVPATSGHLYSSIARELPRYPIPGIRLPSGEGQTLLDIGCNWGRWTIAAARRGYRSIGIDTSLDALLAAAAISRQLSLPIDFVAADARFLPFQRGVFDVVFSYSVLQHFAKDDATTVLRQVREVLNGPGRSLFQMANAWGVRSLYHQLRRGFRKPEAFEVRYWRPHELLRAFERWIGPTELLADGFFGLGIQPADLDLMPRRFRTVIRCSEILRRASASIPWVAYLADSVYLRSRKRDRAQS